MSNNIRVNLHLRCVIDFIWYNRITQYHIIRNSWRLLKFGITTFPVQENVSWSVILHTGGYHRLVFRALRSALENL